MNAERSRLRARGYTDAEISQIFVNRESAGSQGSFSPAQANMTGVLGNASAVLSHARGIIPAVKADVANLFNSQASAASRGKSAVGVVCVAVIVAVLAYAIYQEWQQHIVSATLTASSNAELTAVQARTAEIDLLNKSINSEDIQTAKLWAKVENYTTQQCLTDRDKLKALKAAHKNERTPDGCLTYPLIFQVNENIGANAIF